MNNSFYKLNKLNIHLYHNDLPRHVIFSSPVAIDVELTGLSINKDKLCLMQFSSNGKDIYLVKFDISKPYNSPNIISLLNNLYLQKIFHFSRTDLVFISKYLKAQPVNLFCTKVTSHIVRKNHENHSLVDLCLELLSIKISKQEQCSNWAAETLTESQILYAALDVVYLHKIKGILLDKAYNQGLTNLVSEACAAIPMLNKLDLMGLDETVFNYKLNSINEVM